jgi:hypothetical protein
MGLARLVRGDGADDSDYVAALAGSSDRRPLCKIWRNGRYEPSPRRARNFEVDLKTSRQRVVAA